jgi:hypothetical protein
LTAFLKANGYPQEPDVTLCIHAFTIDLVGLRYPTEDRWRVQERTGWRTTCRDGARNRGVTPGFDGIRTTPRMT